MGVLNYLKSVLPWTKKSTYAAWLKDSVPIFTSFGQDIYLSDYVNNAIDRVASEISKINVKSVVETSEGVNVQNDDITRLFRFKPNPLQTTSDFLSNVEWMRRKKYNVFIYPQYETVVGSNGRIYKRFLALYPLDPQNIYIGVKDGKVWEVQMDFADGSSYTMPYQDLIHIKWRRGKNTIVGGGDDNGLESNYDVIRTIDALDKTIQGLPKSIESSLQIKGVYAAKTTLGGDEIKKARDDFEDHIITSKSGMIATDLAGEFTPINVKAADIPENVLIFLKAVIQERYGVSAAILSGDYNGVQHGAFYQSAIEDIIVQMEQAMTACLFSIREQDVGHRIRCYYSKVNYMDSKSKLELANLAKETGILDLNGIGAMFGLEPFPEGNRRLQSLNYVNLKEVDAYQKSKAGVGEGETNEEN